MFLDDFVLINLNFFVQVVVWFRLYNNIDNFIFYIHIYNAACNNRNSDFFKFYFGFPFHPCVISASAASFERRQAFLESVEMRLIPPDSSHESYSAPHH